MAIRRKAERRKDKSGKKENTTRVKGKEYKQRNDGERKGNRRKKSE